MMLFILSYSTPKEQVNQSNVILPSSTNVWIDNDFQPINKLFILSYSTPKKQVNQSNVILPSSTNVWIDNDFQPINKPL